MGTPGIEDFSKRLDEIFEQGMPTKAQILDAYNKYAFQQPEKELPLTAEEILKKYANILNEYIILGHNDNPFIAQNGIAIILADFASQFHPKDIVLPDYETFKEKIIEIIKSNSSAIHPNPLSSGEVYVIKICYKWLHNLIEKQIKNGR
jgi:hypothetical protein